jgi:pimeloyl-ACP methyl ester carboxylesterase
MTLSGPRRPGMAVLFALILAGPAGAAVSAESKVVTLQPGEGLQVTSIGTGRPVVLIPGLFGAAFAFRRILPKLAAEGFRAVVIEPLGVGDSARPDRASYSLTAQADRVAATMENLGLRDAVLVGHAVGASVAMRLAYRHPERARALVSLEGGPVETAVSPSFRRALKLAPLLRIFGGTALVRHKVRSQLKELSADPSWVTDEVVDGYTRGASRDLGATLKALQRMGEATEPEALSDHLGDIRCPVVLVKGGAPHEGGPDAAEIDMLGKRLQKFTLERAAGAGSYVFEESPDAVVSAVVRAWESGRTLEADAPHPGQ